MEGDAFDQLMAQVSVAPSGSGSVLPAATYQQRKRALPPGSRTKQPAQKTRWTAGAGPSIEPMMGDPSWAQARSIVLLPMETRQDGRMTLDIFLGEHPAGAKKAAEIRGKAPKILRDFYRSKWPNPNIMDKLPAFTQKAMMDVGRSWTPKLEEYSSNMNPTDNLYSALACVGRGMNFIHHALSQVDQIGKAENSRKADIEKLRGSLNKEKKISTSLKNELEKSKKRTNDLDNRLTEAEDKLTTMLTNHEKALAAAKQEAEEARKKAVEEAALNAVAEFKKSTEQRTFINMTYAMAYELIIKDIVKEVPEDVSRGAVLEFLSAQLDAFRKKNSLAPVVLFSPASEPSTIRVGEVDANANANADMTIEVSERAIDVGPQS